MLTTFNVAHASTLSDAANALNPGEWVEIQTSDDETVVETDVGQFDIFDNYSSQMAFDSDSDSVYYIGCSHHNSSTCGFDCKFVKYDIASNTWSDETAHAWDGFPACTDGSNSIAHGYDHSTVDNSRGDYYFRGSFDKIVRKFDISADGTSEGTWSALAPAPITSAPVASGFGYFSSLDKLVYVNSQHDEIAYFDLSDGRWDALQTFGVPSLGNYHDQACDLPKHGLFIIGGGNESDILYSIDSNKAITSIGNPRGVSLNVSSDYATGSIYLEDPASGDLILFSDNGSTYGWNPTNGWADAGIAPKLGTGGSGSVMGHAAVSLKRYGVIMAVRRDGGDVEVWLYKHAQSTPDMQPPSAPENLHIIPTSSSRIDLP